MYILKLVFASIFYIKKEFKFFFNAIIQDRINKKLFFNLKNNH